VIDILPRGEAGRLPWVHSIDLRLAYNYNFTKAAGVQLTFDVFNLVNFQQITARDPAYTLNQVDPVTNGKGLSAAQASDPEMPVNKNPNYRHATAFSSTSCISIRPEGNVLVMAKQLTLNLRGRAGSLLLTAGLSFVAIGCEQPAPKCNITQSMETGGNFAAKYTLKKGSATGTPECKTLPGEVLYFGTFYQRNGDDTPNYDAVTVGIQPESTLGPLANAEGAMVKPDPKDKPYASGAFDSAEPEGDDFCVVSELSPARVRLPVAPAWDMPDPEDETAPPIPQPEQSDLDLKYEFGNVRVYMTAGSPGRQITADLTYTRREKASNIDCSARFSVSALFPATPCGVDELGAPSGKPADNDQACRDNPIFIDDAVECDPDLHLCVLAKPVPSLR